MHTIEIFLSVNEQGDAAVSLETASDARETLVDEFGGEAVRSVKVSLAMDLPQTTEVDVEVPHRLKTSRSTLRWRSRRRSTSTTPRRSWSTRNGDGHLGALHT